MTARPFIIDVAGQPLSGLRAEPAQGQTAATIMALPGGGYTSPYWHHPNCPGASLLTIGSMLGYRVVALDRPGYGVSAERGCGGMLLDEQAALLTKVVDALGREPGAGAGVFLIGHSMGGILSLMIAALRQTSSLLGLDVSGVPYRFSDEITAAVQAEIEAPVRSPGELPSTAMFYGPPDTFDGRLLEHDPSAAPAPLIELEDSFGWASRFVDVAARVDRPVQYTLGEYETVTRSDPEALDEIRSLFTASPKVVTRRQAGAGHNISLHNVGRAYHLNAFGFFDEILATSR